MAVAGARRGPRRRSATSPPRCCRPARRRRPRSCPGRRACSPARACATEAFAQLDAAVVVEWSAADGDAVAGRQRRSAPSSGPLASILTAERTALNFLGHLSGVATLTRRFVDGRAAAGGTARVWDTRKTTPGLRSLEKAAVRAGGGWNHRGNLSRLGDVQGQPPRPARHRRGGAPGPGHVAGPHGPRRGRPLDKVSEALEAGADAMLLDNMAPDGVRRPSPSPTSTSRPTAAAARCSRPAAASPSRPSAPTPPPASTSCRTGQITISAPVLDIGLDIADGDIRSVIDLG